MTVKIPARAMRRDFPEIGGRESRESPIFGGSVKGRRRNHKRTLRSTFVGRMDGPSLEDDDEDEMDTVFLLGNLGKW